jgi:hypothetical protein
MAATVNASEDVEAGAGDSKGLPAPQAKKSPDSGRDFDRDAVAIEPDPAAREVFSIGKHRNRARDIPAERDDSAAAKLEEPRERQVRRADDDRQFYVDLFDR